MHLFSKENIWSNPHASSHPDKHNNSVDRIISKEEEREDPRRDSSIYFRVQWCFHIPTRTTVFHTQSNKFPVIPCYSTYRINSSTRNTTTTRLIPCRLLPVTAPVSPSILHGRIRLPDSLQHSRAIQHKQASSEFYPVETAF